MTTIPPDSGVGTRRWSRSWCWSRGRVLVSELAWGSEWESAWRRTVTWRPSGLGVLCEYVVVLRAPPEPLDNADLTDYRRCHTVFIDLRLSGLSSARRLDRPHRRVIYDRVDEIRRRDRSVSRKTRGASHIERNCIGAVLQNTIRESLIDSGNCCVS